MKKVRIAGVPEHFNFPWLLSIEEGAFEQRGIDLQWTDVPEGTGKMIEMLQAGATDLAIILTEGIIKGIIEGNRSKIVQQYVASPLLWGIHVGAKSRFRDISELKSAKIAISRFGSGSHLMAYVNAENQGWDTGALQFEVVNNLEGAVKALTNATADYFMWEHFTTKPIVDSGIFRRLGDCPTPWPCFVIAATDTFVTENSGALGHILQTINTYTSEFKDIPSIDRTLANQYGQKLDDVQEWLSMTYWSQSKLNEAVLEKVQSTLKGLGLVAQKLATTDFFTNQ
ncbi:MAG: substrate-binding domain-containing protein [Maribacter sp.]|nr:substrate-binding domain-containing protein [Maribacter sp.]